jgi:ABC-type dipeptide/oligopeptide/nickel transport system ATPase component
MSIIEHLTYVAARAQLHQALGEIQPGGMVFLVGPSGAGKTTLRHAVMREMFGKPSYWGQGRIPIIETTCMLPNNAYYNSREQVKSLIRQLHAPSLKWLFNSNHSIDPELEEQLEREIKEARGVWSQLRLRCETEGDYWDVFQTSLEARSCKYISMEHANALLKNRKNTLPADHTFHLLSFAEKAGVIFIMTGVSQCTALWSVHHELRRRVIPVWFRPYTTKESGDHLQFLRLLKTLSTKYTLSRPDLLYLMADDLMAATGGLLGHVVAVMETARIRARGEGAKKILQRHIVNAFYNDEDLRRVWKDVRDFEIASTAGSVSKHSQLIVSEWQRSAKNSKPSFDE